MTGLSFPLGEALSPGKPAPCGAALPPLLKIRLAHYTLCASPLCRARLNEWEGIKQMAARP